MSARTEAMQHRSSTLVSRNVIVARRRTSVRLEPVMWDALRDIGRRRGKSVNEIISDIDRERTASSLTAAIRIYLVEFYREGLRREEVSDDPTNEGIGRVGEREPA